MKESKRKVNPVDDGRNSKTKENPTVRGSGFTYTENRKRTDVSVSVNEVKEDEVVQLPDMGLKNRP